MGDRAFFGAILWLAYFGVLEILSRVLSKSPLCMLVSEKNQANNQTGEQTCATLSEGVIRAGWFLWNHADHNAVTAFSTVLIAIFTFTLYRSTTKLWQAGKEQLKATNESIELATKEFVASHRPKIRIRRIFRLHPLMANLQVKIRIEAANIGDTDAHIFEMGLATYIRGTPFNATPVPHARLTVPCGRQANIDALGGLKLTVGQPEQIENGTTTLCLLGIINYMDDNDTVRTTSFFRIYNHRLGRFAKSPDPDDPDNDLDYEN